MSSQLTQVQIPNRQVTERTALARMLQPYRYPRLIKEDHMRLIALLLILIAPAANAYIVTYEYVGAEYDYVLDPAADPSAVGNPFLDRTQNRVTGHFYLDTDYLADGDHRNETITYSIPLFTGCEIEGCKP